MILATSTPPQVCMTLSALAATAATPRPSGETRDQQTCRVAAGISQQLTALWLATRASWQLAWLALSPDDANMVCIAKTIDASNQFAVVARGTVGNITDILEDLDVGTVVPFTASGSPTPVAVSKGAMTAFTQVTGMVSIPAPRDVQGAQVPEGAFAYPGATLVQALAALVQAAPTTPRATVYVTGHSLGGSIATMLAPYLYTQAQSWTNVPQFALETFAAPTAGLQSFVTYVNGLPFPNNHHVNAWDAVPLAWSDLAEVKQDHWYPDPPGPAGNITVHHLFDVLNGLTKGNVYVQPGVRQQLPLDGDYSTHNPALTNSTVADFMGQVAYQHANNTYLSLLQTSLLTPTGPTVTSVSPSQGGSGTPVVIEGDAFLPDSVLDFGPIPCTDFTIKPGGDQINATVPKGVGIVDVRVTNILGTSPAVPLGQFAYDGPAPLVVTSVSPTSGRAGTTKVTISGSGFPKNATVQFKDKPSNSVTWISETQLTATAPAQVDDSQTVNITVWVNDIGSPTSPADEFTYTGI
ncbi:IPT/TIG domain-containing protein [Streptomyces sp. NPDC048416]|uniref:IPT/TIG domain-containing protein n=1 Tax=Streptomyces sp. NPDC048416 TaxID=3365546 RepID=UPI0037184996